MIGIGNFIWIFDINYRVYKKEESGRSFGAPIWKDHWRKYVIVGETSRSWIIDRWDTKIPKKGGHGIAFSEEEINKLAFVEENKYRIAKMVEKCGYEKLIAIANIVDYKTPD